MNKYIDAEKLIAEIERYENTASEVYNPLGEDADFWHGKVVAYKDLKTLVTSLQQEQPEVDLDNKIEKYLRGWVARDKDGRLLFYTNKPWKYDGKSWAASEGEWMEIDKTWYPNVKWEDEEPTETAFATIDESELTHGKTVKTEEVPDDRAYCKEHCKGYRESGGKCYFGFNCGAKKESEAEKNWIPKFKVGDLFIYNGMCQEAKIYKVKRVVQGECVSGYWCGRLDVPTMGHAWFSSSEEKYMELEPEEKQTIEISSTKEAEEIINFIKDCFDKLKQNFHGYCLDINWKYYEAALEVLRPEYTSYQQGFNAGHKEGYEARKREEKKIVEEIKEYLDELKDVKID